ncbi:tRNA N6-adenosine(37)-N6-threonylcarbamoyltransferase complex dimerization subunit TsaB [Paenibacillus sp. BIHB 4019]|uniref:tRNA N6-adenosine(37)-N6-threonylcarbamoyltransferase complex dimerization subunit TsaB n=1 Tax=Paenibacillus sp. BIHB 4019 TaxID=1870819 RepID=A0A1B2DII7_9BACL|nr:tRNA (adenosine(37)-N6)-threonylcarbamoyltransferase complex dimerization subunit type 1 TsaB [Paenibacillus sp. BIHB 4019]ANY67509.1 tRNA N6-adenosine(37)-N6-threonylcarbamoyltransferase complex dimerization subunit TsaB [Paenibacillus sp. BIHB 4019]
MVEQAEQPILAFDTSTAALAAAVIQGDRIIGEIQSFAERNHSVYIITHLKQLLEDCGVSKKELGGIAVGGGPGSYTGMRIAVTAAKTLAWTWDKPLVALSSLEAIAYGACERLKQTDAMISTVQQPIQADHPNMNKMAVWFIPIMDARRGQVYTASFSYAYGDQWKRRAPDGIRLMRDWVDQLLEQVQERGQEQEQKQERAELKPTQDPAGYVTKIYITGDLKLHEAEAQRLVEGCAEAGVEVSLFPHELEGRAIAELGRKRLLAGDIDDLHTLAPNYTQLHEAEVKLQEKEASLKAEQEAERAAAQTASLKAAINADVDAARVKDAEP